ncbi:phytanoyl-CoA dioxygenase family protein [uncultured Algibacter sp.]|uniref:phytanoyl-CoA dioxygenase family protein n=1 Tax=uncultured Algibacter sp. TaxID=298659 RepID=UPI0026049A12|nr:phytanoyl-CoA dioxygenase family protein [uncultured Algibacter sp.]
MLKKKQIEFYHSNGYLVLETIFSEEEIIELNSKLKNFKNHTLQPNVICEDNGDIRSIFAPETQEPLFGNLIRDKRVLTASEELLNNSLYLYQYKLNLKEAFAGKFWEWHQDYPYWHYGDGVKSPDMISVMVLLDDVKSYQGPLLVIPKSHKAGIVDFQHKAHLENKKDNLLNSLNSDLKYTISNKLVKESALLSSIVSLEGKRGTVVFFHPNIFHASNTNVSPFTRSTAILTYNSINNVPEKKSSRPDYICYRDSNPLQATI